MKLSQILYIWALKHKNSSIGEFMLTVIYLSYEGEQIFNSYIIQLDVEMSIDSSLGSWFRSICPDTFNESLSSQDFFMINARSQNVIFCIFLIFSFAKDKTKAERKKKVWQEKVGGHVMLP